MRQRWKEKTLLQPAMSKSLSPLALNSRRARDIINATSLSEATICKTAAPLRQNHRSAETPRARSKCRLTQPMGHGRRALCRGLPAECSLLSSGMEAAQCPACGWCSGIDRRADSLPASLVTADLIWLLLNCEPGC